MKTPSGILKIRHEVNLLFKFTTSSENTRIRFIRAIRAIDPALSKPKDINDVIDESEGIDAYDVNGGVFDVFDGMDEVVHVTQYGVFEISDEFYVF